MTVSIFRDGYVVSCRTITQRYYDALLAVSMAREGMVAAMADQATYRELTATLRQRISSGPRIPVSFYAPPLYPENRERLERTMRMMNLGGLPASAFKGGGLSDPEE